MLAQLIATAFAGAFNNALAGANAALLCKRSMSPHSGLKRAASGPHRRPVRVQLRVAGASMAPGDARRPDARQLDARYADQEFIARQIRSHREAIALYQRNMKGPDAQLRVFARDILPQLQDHLTMLESLKSEGSRGQAARGSGEHRDVPLGRRPS
jgi:Domain of unknown function (DUF4142)